MFTGEGVWVVTVRQQQHFHLHTFLQQHVRTTHSSMDTSFITIIEQGDVLGKAMQQSYLINGKSRSRVGYHILDATLVHGYHISIALHHIDPLFLRYCFLGLINTIELAFLMINF